MRLDRFLTLSVFHPLVRVGLGSRGLRLPILMYHSISDDPENGIAPYYRTSTRPERFAQQMAWLHTKRYRAVTLTQGLEWLSAAERSGSLPDPCVVLTFDDGFRDFHRAAFPILQRYDFRATVFLPTAYIDDAPKLFKRKECLTWREAEELHRAGIEFGSHTVSHPRLVDLGWSEIQRELLDSKTMIERRLGSAVTVFAYPYAFPQADSTFVQQFRALLQTVGYRACVTTEIGPAYRKSERLQLKRLPVNTADDAALFWAKIEGGYDWLGCVQYAFKQWKYRRSRSAPLGWWNSTSLPLD